jgi:ATP phosphoribosyltransferase
MDGQPGQVMLQALCPDELGWRQLEAIQRAGARELFVLPVERALA